MAAPQIPNLLTSRNNINARGAARGGRGRGRGGGLSNDIQQADPELDQAAKDKIVQQTDQDASVSRLSAVEAGYFNDPFTKLFVVNPGPRKFPIINRGTYLRTYTIDRLVDTFLSSAPEIKKQIISLGAGSDTRPFRLLSRRPRLNLVYHELDFPANNARKLDLINGSSDLLGCVGSPVQFYKDDKGHHVAIESPYYQCHSLDLRSLYPPHPSKPSPPSLGYIDRSLPTLLISECCLIYLQPNDADAVVSYFTSYLFRTSTQTQQQNTPLGLILYEPTSPNDAFGRTMIANLATRGIVLSTIQKYHSLAAQRQRLKDYGFEGGGGVSGMDWLWEAEDWVGDHERERVNSVELLDEIEEWIMLGAHYCLAWGWRGGGDSEVSGELVGFWAGWKRLRAQVA